MHEAQVSSAPHPTPPPQLEHIGGAAPQCWGPSANGSPVALQGPRGLEAHCSLFSLCSLHAPTGQLKRPRTDVTSSPCAPRFRCRLRDGPFSRRTSALSGPRARGQKELGKERPPGSASRWKPASSRSRGRCVHPRSGSRARC